ncbi:MAG: D-amino-acid transaminase [Alphaproteobacteria bacterium]|nr:D-amino-acid transaminase [Alphaproteobacteria bacterium]
MSRVAYVNGRYVPHRDAAVHIEDRGYQFADGVYEVIAVAGGRLVDEAGHLARLRYSLGELGIPRPMTDRALAIMLREVVRRNLVKDGVVYLQVTRGVARRDHGWADGMPPSVVATARPKKQPTALAAKGVSVITVPDLRWKRCDIKTVGLLPNVMAKQLARAAGAFEAWMVDDQGNVTEGTSSNAWIVTRDGAVVTRKADSAILNGITRTAVVEAAAAAGLALQTRPFSVDEALGAAEAFVTSTTSFVLPVISIDGRPVGDGKPGPMARKLLGLYCEKAGLGE